MRRTRRQQIVERLAESEWEFDDLRHEFGLTVKVLEEDLRHIERSVRAAGQRLIVRPARCEVCDFLFKSTALHPPGRCPSCRDRRIIGPWFSIA
jgi:predicted Zn-ribbon and HTH transcriptional regulator